MTSHSEDEDHVERRPDELDGVPAIRMGLVSASMLDRIVSESRSEAERQYHEARWDQIFGN